MSLAKILLILRQDLAARVGGIRIDSWRRSAGIATAALRGEPS
ncbi:hypothetical protein [Trichothermofontia sp.]